MNLAGSDTRSNPGTQSCLFSLQDATAPWPCDFEEDPSQALTLDPAFTQKGNDLICCQWVFEHPLWTPSINETRPPFEKHLFKLAKQVNIFFSCTLLVPLPLAMRGEQVVEFQNSAIAQRHDVSRSTSTEKRREPPCPRMPAVKKRLISQKP